MNKKNITESEAVPPEKSKNKAALCLVIVIIFLVIACFVLVRLNNTSLDANAEEGKVAIVCNGEKAAAFEVDDLKAMESTDIKKHISSGSGKDEDGVFTGVNLKDVISAAGIALTGSEENITVKSEDGYTTAFDIDEVLADDCILLVYEKDGQLLGGRSDGGNGPFRIIAVDDMFGTRCAKYVNIIEVNS
jgi:DMSO/TMAO reductase YedYZ molybdopterin-dependent catalytic subunit